MSSKGAVELLNDMIFELEASLAVSNVSSCSAVAAPAASAPPTQEKTQQQQKKAPAPIAPATEEKAPITVNSLDLRVGLIRTCKKHETAEKLYCEEIDVGESEPRAIASGLVPHYSLEEMVGRRIIVVCNLKPRNLVGFKSNGMVLCAVNKRDDGSEKVEFVDPPAEAAVGDRITGEGLIAPPLTASQCDKQKAFEVVAANLRVDADGLARWGELLLIDPCGRSSKAPTVRNGIVR